MYDRDNQETVERPNKSQAKREAAAVHTFVLRLMRLTSKQRKLLDLPEEVAAALEAAALIHSHSARGRQIKYVAFLLRNSDRCAEIMAMKLERL